MRAANGKQEINLEWPYGCYIQVFGFREGHKSAFHLLRTAKKGVADGFYSVDITRLVNVRTSAKTKLPAHWIYYGCIKLISGPKPGLSQL